MKKAALIGTVIGCALAASFAYASIPDSGGVIRACRDTRYGYVRIIDTAVTPNCASGEAAVSWSQTGPPGPQGTPGTPGTPGAQGPAGPAGPGFTHDTGQSLVFFLFQNVQLISSTSVTMKPFIESPDGTVIAGTAQLVITSGSAASASLAVRDPIFGAYQFGWEAVAAPADTAALLFGGTSDLVTPSRSGVNVQASVPDIQFANSAQTSGTFVYGAVGTVP
jgi:hypothetical protein